MAERWQYKPTYFGNKTIGAEVIGDALTQLEEAGTLTASAVVTAARPRTAPLHPLFEWRNREAAELYRLGQARQLIRSIEIVTETPERDAPREIRPAFIHVPSGHREEGHYATPARLVAAPSQYEMALTEALRQAEVAARAVEFLRRLVEGQESATVARMATIQEAFSLIRTELESLRAA